MSLYLPRLDSVATSPSKAAGLDLGEAVRDTGRPERRREDGVLWYVENERGRRESGTGNWIFKTWEGVGRERKVVHQIGQKRRRGNVVSATR